MTTNSDHAAGLIRQLNLQPHPEGGHYRENYRAAETVTRADGVTARAAATQIYYLLRAGEKSRWHRVWSDELWLYHEGAPLEIFDLDPVKTTVRRLLLGPAGPDASPCHLIPAGHWQAARPTGDYLLASCAVAPGFDFADFMLIADLTGEWQLIANHFPELVDLL